MRCAPISWSCAITHPARWSLLAQKVDCSVINAGDGAHEHPTQALLDALPVAK
jgi:aspartate carbamoyltransferase catalytic subunit